MSDNEVYLLIKYIKSFFWRVAKCLSYIQDARFLKVKMAKKQSYVLIIRMGRNLLQEFISAVTLADKRNVIVQVWIEALTFCQSDGI